MDLHDFLGGFKTKQGLKLNNTWLKTMCLYRMSWNPLQKDDLS